MPKVMSREEREAFLAEVHVGVLSVAAGEARGPLTVPLWYAYEPGGPVRFQTLPEARKARLIRATGRASLCVQSEAPPYRYVTVEGPTTQTHLRARFGDLLGRRPQPGVPNTRPITRVPETCCATSSTAGSAARLARRQAGR